MSDMANHIGGMANGSKDDVVKTLFFSSQLLDHKQCTLPGVLRTQKYDDDHSTQRRELVESKHATTLSTWRAAARIEVQVHTFRCLLFVMSK
jgi:hypothetical protein